MISLFLNILNEEAIRPKGNPFRVRGFRWDAAPGPVRQYRVFTGISVTIPDDLMMRIEPLTPKTVILGHYLGEENELVLYLKSFNERELDAALFKKDDIALVSVVSSLLPSIRFMEKQGKSRVIMGDHSETDRSPEDA